jgi:undecaprenyldiphospho-muramoylpentapeptide beta-N-acetylglucosaminyltransferase
VSAPRFALVAGGGTGGHLVPALAVAHALGARRHPDAVELVGSRRGLDRELWSDAGMPVTLLPGRGLVRRLTWRAVTQNVGALLGLVAATAGALVLMARRRPAVVVAVGGYASVPTSLAAAAWRVPVVLVNVDAVPGAANRLIARFARVTAVAFAGTPLPRTVLTGAPVSAAVVAAAPRRPQTRRSARASLGLPGDGLVVGAVGGSLGARHLNEAMLGLAERWSHRADVAIYHVVGRRDAAWASALATVGTDGGLRYVQVPYERRMDLLYAAADVMVGRAGALTVAELAVVGVPAVLVPLPDSPGDHQQANARVLEEVGGAVVVPDDQCTPERLASEIDAIAVEPGRLAAMASASAALGRRDAAARIAELAERYATAPTAAAWSAHAR